MVAKKTEIVVVGVLATHAALHQEVRTIIEQFREVAEQLHDVNRGISGMHINIKGSTVSSR